MPLWPVLLIQKLKRMKTKLYRVWMSDGGCMLIDAESIRAAMLSAQQWQVFWFRFDVIPQTVELL